MAQPDRVNVDLAPMAENTFALAFEDAALSPDGRMNLNEVRYWYSTYTA